MNQQGMWEKRTSIMTVDRVVKSYHNPSPFQIELKNEINIIANKNNYKDIIEVGCETGVTSMLLDDNFNKTLLDLNPNAIELAKKAADRLGKNGNFVVGDMFSMDFPNDSFDIVFNAGVIEHFNFEERVKLLFEYKRILKENGTMIISYPNHYSTPYRSAYLIRNYIFWGYNWPFPKEFKILDLSKEIKQAGLKLEEKKTLSKETSFIYWDFFKPGKNFFKKIDKKFNFEGYLTLLVIQKSKDN